MILFKKVNYCDIENLRNQYFDSIGEAQELYIELMVNKSDYYLITDQEIIGYFVISFEKAIVEYHLLQSRIKDCEWIFEKIIQDFYVERIFCKSFDSILLKCCLKCIASYKVIGTLFRGYFDIETPESDGLQIRKAVQGDIPYLLKQTDELYETEEELYWMVDSGSIIMYHINDQWIGCGFLIKTIENRNYYDIGMWVKTEFRKKGYATKIIANLKKFCLRNNMVPTCGCAVENIASRKTLEKNGFFSKHDLIEFKVK